MGIVRARARARASGLGTALVREYHIPSIKGDRYRDGVKLFISPHWTIQDE